MHKLDKTSTLHLNSVKEDPRYIIFGWDFVGYSSKDLGTRIETDYGFDSYSNTIIKREREKTINVDYLHYYRILEEKIRDDIIPLENEYNEKIKNHKYEGKYISWFFYFIKIYLPIALACMFIFAYIPIMILGMTEDKTLIENPYEKYVTLIIFFGFFVGLVASALFTKKESNKANLTSSIKLLKKHKDFKLIIEKTAFLLNENNNDFIRFNPKEEIVFDKVFLNMKAFKRSDQGLIIPSGVFEVGNLELNPETYKYVYIPKDVERFPYVWFKNKKVTNYYNDNTKQAYTKYPNHLIFYEGTEKEYRYPEDMKDLYRYHFQMKYEDVKNVVLRSNILI